ncbi:hypothetical protein GM415_08885 [Pseudodesulfovibrio cashew]|uniref:Uncharacterized protein n=1 Tax=Pseudodesulfovibrio cashew TaxID=2678688 RepID=A0A6I6JBT3_9BACT|nr:DUF1131 family protein [Pseudodesulfovibrio cashew]QGY40236.1 hypothetical protein GM415_08885 [Pseudodesulfovibrio cashew]
MFDIITGTDLLDKAKRELTKYQQQPNSDNLFNLFVTIRHIEDYAKYKFATRKSRNKYHKKIEDTFGDLYPWMLFICNKQKHCKVSTGVVGQAMEGGHVQYAFSGEINGAPLNELPINGGDEYRVEYNGATYELGQLAAMLIGKWENLL